ncbi:MAG: Amidophosphoribosyltransferase [Myxococcota bacterium]|nr:Amidophosphoribosyltransferase [Myxococcota bacterium]
MGFHDECGVFGVYDHPEAANFTYLGLHSLQHRGQESAGIVATDGTSFFQHKGMGRVGDVFRPEDIKDLKGRSAIGHVRYSTSGKSTLKNAQPIAIEYSLGKLAVGHNGNLVNIDKKRRELVEHGSIFTSEIDTEILVHLIATSRKPTVVDRIRDALSQVNGAYSLAILTDKQLIAVRDPYGFRPLVLGSVQGSPVIASETCALELIDGEYVREIEPGEILVVDSKGMHSEHLEPAPRLAKCIFEHVYFARPDSHLFGRGVYETRKELGRQLARESHVPADVVIPVPDSGVPAALGYAGEAKIPYEMGLVRSHYVGRTFIEPRQSIRHFGVRLKLSPNRDLLQGRRVVVIDDSIVRGTTSRKIVNMIRAAGAKEVHMRISSPPTTHPCFYGIDTPTREELIGANMGTPEINRYLGSDTLAYLSMEGLHRAVGSDRKSFCDACFSGAYPIPVE